MSIEFEGLENIEAYLGNLANNANMTKALAKACAIVERSAKEKAPKGIGELRRSITSKVEEDKGIVYTPLEYAPYVEYGTGIFAEDNKGRKNVPWRYQDDKGKWHITSGMKPSPYMRPALNENRDRIIKILQESLLKDD